MKICSIPGCGRPCHGLGYCNPHYHRLIRHGNPEGGFYPASPRDDGLKMCSKCGVPKHPDNFYKHSASKEDLQSSCKQCSKLRGRNRYQKEHVKIREQKRIYNKENSHKSRNARLIRSYGLSLKDYEKLLVAQKGVCAICGKPETSSKRKNLSVDHCHITGRIRGLLCGACNLAVGNVKESPEIGRRLVSYLEKHLKLLA